MILLQERADLKGGRGHASMVLKCKLCSRENSIGKTSAVFQKILSGTQSECQTDWIQIRPDKELMPKIGFYLDQIV